MVYIGLPFYLFWQIYFCLYTWNKRKSAHSLKVINYNKTFYHVGNTNNVTYFYWFKTTNFTQII